MPNATWGKGQSPILGHCQFRLVDADRCGVIGLNDGVPSTSNAPFGGVKQSGWGRELGSEGLEEFLETKDVSIGVIEKNAVA